MYSSDNISILSRNKTNYLCTMAYKLILTFDATFSNQTGISGFCLVLCLWLRVEKTNPILSLKLL